MMDESAVMVVCQLFVNVGTEPVSADSFHDRAKRLMDELMKLDGCNDDIADPTVSSDARRHVMTVDILVRTDDPLEAVNKTSWIIRTALHAAGARTPGWAVERIENRTEAVQDLAIA